MVDAFQTLLDTQITLGQALPLVTMAALLILAATMASRSSAPPRKDRRGATQAPFARAEGWLERGGIGPFGRVVFWIIAAAFLALFFLALAAAFVLVTDAITDATRTPAAGDTPTASLGLGALLVALLGAPFLIWRTVVAQWTLDTARKEAALKEEAIFNDKINAAAKDLAARREVTRVQGHGKEKRVLTEWEDDLVTRAAAIDRLESLAIEAIDRGDYPPAQRIARMLSIYVQELSREYPAKQVPDYQGRDQFREWVKDLKPARPDMERAVQALGRINPEDDRKRADFDPKHIDLRDCNLQGFDLTGSNLQGSRLRGAQMQGARLRKARLAQAILVGEFLDRNDIPVAQMQGADLTAADLRGTDLNKVNLQAIRAIHAVFQGASLKCTDLRGADLGGAQLQGALLYGTKIDDQTKFDLSDTEHPSPTGFDGAAIVDLGCDAVKAIRGYLGMMIGGEKWRKDIPSEPDGLRPGKLSKHNYSDEFEAEWRAWAAKHHPDVIIAPDYRDHTAK